MDAVVRQSSQRDKMIRGATEVHTIRPRETLPTGEDIDACSAFLPSRRALLRTCCAEDRSLLWVPTGSRRLAMVSGIEGACSLKWRSRCEYRGCGTRTC